MVVKTVRQAEHRLQRALNARIGSWGFLLGSEILSALIRHDTVIPQENSSRGAS